MRRFDVVVIGAGPAGLSAAAELSRDRGSGPCLLLDRGRLASARDRASPDDLLAGVGGAGLFSDGKHSFFPAATALWKLPDRDALGAAFDATAALLRKHGVEATLPGSQVTHVQEDDVWQPKRYPSIYVPFAERLACIDELWSASPDRHPEARVVDAERGDEIRLHVDPLGEIHTRALVIATGRWSPLWTRPWLERLGVSFAFQRDEIGVRIETASDHPLFAALPGVDGKLVLRDAGLEIRTFCTCRDGEVVLGHEGGVRAYSGRADGPRTGRSNVGLVVRGRLGDAVARAARAQPVQFPLAASPGPLVDVFGELGAAAIAHAIERLRGWTSIGDATIYAPSIEGVGDYPVDDNLQIAPNVWIAGDACGRFRGIVASLVSGRYVAHRIRSTRA